MQSFKLGNGDSGHKQYWLYGLLIGIVTPFIIAVIWPSLAWYIDGSTEPFIQHLTESAGMLIGFLMIPALTVSIPLGIIFGWLYGKIKS